MIFYYLLNIIYDYEPPMKKISYESAAQKPNYSKPDYYDVEKGYPNCFVINVDFSNKKQKVYC